MMIKMTSALHQSMKYFDRERGMINHNWGGLDVEIFKRKLDDTDVRGGKEGRSEERWYVLSDDASTIAGHQGDCAQ